MRRSSTTVSGPATVRPRRYGEKLLQNSNDNTRPSAPATIRMIPTVLMLNPELVTLTAKVKMAPTINRKMLTPRLTLLASFRMLRQLTVRRVLHVWLSSKTLSQALLLRFLTSTARRSGAAELSPRPERPTRIGSIGLGPSTPVARQPSSVALHLEPPLVVGLRPPAPDGFLATRS